MIRILYSFFIFILISCSSSNEKKISSLTNKLLILEKSFNELDLNEVTKAVEGYKSNLILVKKCVDSIENEFVINIKNYKAMKRSAPEFFNNYNLTKKNLKIEQDQLGFFKEDLDNGLINEDSISAFITLEENNVNKIVNDIHQVIDRFNFIKSTNDTLYPYIKNFAERYCQKNEK